MSNQKLKSTEIITYCGDKNRVEVAINAGATHLILDHPMFSIRSLLKDYSSNFEQHYTQLSQFAKSLKSDIKLSIQCDLIMHQEHEKDLLQLAAFLNQLKPDYIRLQDQGLISFFKIYCPQIKLSYMQEMGNANTESVKAYSNHVDRQQFSLDLTYDDMEKINQVVKTKYDCFIQGPILIQHSKRRYLAGMDEEASPDSIKLIHRIAQDEEYPGRLFDFYDNQHGHFMFAYFDRSLLRHITDLVSLNLSGWIIDARGESDHYLKTSLELYISELKIYLKSPSTYQFDRTHLETLLKVARKPQKPGFFKANQTDRQRYNTYLPNESEYLKIGRVLDIIKGKRITIELTQEINTQTILYAFHPKCDGLILNCEKLWDLKNNLVKQSTGNRLIQINWVKGIQQNSQLFIKQV